MSLGLSARRSVLLHIRSLIDEAGGGSFMLFNTTMASDPADAPGGDPLAIVAAEEVSCVMDETLAIMTIAPVVGNAALSGTPTWCRIANGAGVGVADFTAGPPGSGAVVIVTNEEDPPTAQLFTGGELTISGTIAFPA